MSYTNSSPQAPLPDAVIFDMDGLLLDTEQVSWRSFDHLAKARGIADAETFFPKLVGRNRADHLKIFTQYLPQAIDPVAFDNDWKAAFQELLAEHVPVKADAETMLAYLKAKNIPLGLATSSARQKAVSYLGRAGLLEYFNALVGGDEIPSSKPAPDIYIEATQRLGVETSKALAFEDSDNGVRSAHAAGLRVVQIPDLAQPSAEVLAFGHMTATSLTEAARKLRWPDFPTLT